MKAILRRAQAKFDFPIDTTSDEPKRLSWERRRTRKAKTATTEPGHSKRKGIVYPQDLIAAGLINPPVTIFKHNKGRDLEATIRADGKVVFQNEVCNTPSTAAEFARKSVTGRRMQTNGWTFWQIRDENGELVELDTVRLAFNQRKGL